MSVLSVLWVGQRVMTTSGDAGTVVAVDTPPYGGAGPRGVGVRFDWHDNDPEWLRDGYIPFPYSQVRPL